MPHYLTLVMGIFWFLVAILSFQFSFGLGLFYLQEHDDEPIQRARFWLALLVGCVSLFAAEQAWGYHVYLRATAPEVLKVFGIWYSIGFVSRFLVLTKRHEVLSPVYATDWLELYFAFWYALGGPLVTLHLIRVLLFERDASI